jgi:hypothetical protein
MPSLATSAPCSGATKKVTGQAALEPERPACRRTGRAPLYAVRKCSGRAGVSTSGVHFLSVRTPTASRLVVGASRPATPVERQACLLSGERMCDTAHGECPWTVGSTGWNAVPAELG